jgi:hypothetical protein
MAKMTVAKAVRIWCAYREQTMGELAVRIGFDSGYFSKALRGLVPYSDDLRKALQRETGIDLAADEGSWRSVVSTVAQQEVA